LSFLVDQLGLAEKTSGPSRNGPEVFIKGTWSGSEGRGHKVHFVIVDREKEKGFEPYDQYGRNL